MDFAADGTVLSADHVGELGAAIRTGKLLIAKDPSEVVTTPRIILGSSLDKSIRRKLRDHSATVPRQVPSPPSDFQGRTAVVEQLITALLAARDGNVAAVRGMGGIGKTTVAALVADQMEIAFPDGTVWVNGFGTRAGVRPSPDDTIGRVIHTIDPVSRLADTLEEKRATYVSLLRHRRCLIVVDDVADSEIPSLLTPTEPSALIVTSRRRFALPGLHTIDLPPLLAEEALAFVQTILLSSDRKMSRDEVMELVHRCACLPLALRAAGAFLSENPGWKTRDYLNLLGQTRNRLDALQPEDAELNVRRILGFSYDRLEEQDARLAERWRFLTLIPASFDDVAAAAVWDCSVHEARDSLANLRRRTLLEFDRGSDRYRFHDLMRDLAEEVLTKHDEAPRV